MSNWWEIIRVKFHPSGFFFCVMNASRISKVKLRNGVPLSLEVQIKWHRRREIGFLNMMGSTMSPRTYRAYSTRSNSLFSYKKHTQQTNTFDFIATYVMRQSPALSLEKALLQPWKVRTEDKTWKTPQLVFASIGTLFTKQPNKRNFNSITHTNNSLTLSKPSSTAPSICTGCFECRSSRSTETARIASSEINDTLAAPMRVLKADWTECWWRTADTPRTNNVFLTSSQRERVKHLLARTRWSQERQFGALEESFAEAQRRWQEKLHDD